jgi:hypothetical protein
MYQEVNNETLDIKYNIAKLVQFALNRQLL